MKKIALLMFLLIITFSFISASNCPPSIPKTYIGSVSNNGAILTGNYEIRAKIGIDVVGIGDLSNGQYEIDVSPCSGITGQIIFSINGVQASPTGSYNGMSDWGTQVNLNLSVNTIPSTSETCGDGNIQLGEECDKTNLAGRNINDCGAGWTGTISCNTNCLIDYSNCIIGAFCGDGVCNNGETCSSCSQDCGACSTGGGGGGGSGGGGGGSSSGTTTSNPPAQEGTIHAVSSSQISDGITQELMNNDIVQFSIANTEGNSEQHTLTINSVGTNSATITIASTPVTITLNTGESKKLDLTNDDFYDLSVKLEEIYDGKAKITIKSIHEEIPEEPEGGQTPITGGVIGFAKSGKGIALIFVVLIIIVGSFIIFRKKK